jgi:hypothetical protein
MLDQIGQDLERLSPQGDLFAAAPERAAFQVQFVLAEPVLAAPAAFEWSCSAQPVPSSEKYLTTSSELLISVRLIKI